VPGREVFTHRVERFPRHAVRNADPREDAESLRLYEYFPPRTPVILFLSGIVVRAEEPLAVPTVSSHGLLHAPRRIAVLPGFGSQPAPERDLRQLPGGQDEQAGDEDGFRDLPSLFVV